MSPLKRTERAAAKSRSRGGRHARPAEQRMTAADAPAELRPTDYGFPTVHLPDGHPHVTRAELIAALDDEPNEDETPTETLPVVGKVLDGEPKPVHVEGLEPAAAPSIPVPSVPFLNAAAPQTRERVEALESAIVGRPLVTSAPVPVLSPAPRHGAPKFDPQFWGQIGAHQRRVHAMADTLAANYDQTDAAMAERLARLEQRHRDMLAQHGAPPLPHRTPGAALAAIGASRGELVAR